MTRSGTATLSQAIARSHWIAVACADHVARGRAEGFMQVGHGKGAPLRRIKPGDVVAYYSPTTSLTAGTPKRAFTALGVVAPGEVYQGDMGNGFHPFRRDVAWQATRDAEIAPLLGRLAFTAGKTNWGYPFRFGLFKIEGADMTVIAEAMGTTV